VTWRPTTSQLEQLLEFGNLPLEDTAARMGVDVTDLMIFAARLEMGRAYGLAQAEERDAELKGAPGQAKDVPSIPAGFPSMMRGR